MTNRIPKDQTHVKLSGRINARQEDGSIREERIELEAGFGVIAVGGRANQTQVGIQIVSAWPDDESEDGKATMGDHLSASILAHLAGRCSLGEGLILYMDRLGQLDDQEEADRLVMEAAAGILGIAGGARARELDRYMELLYNAAVHATAILGSPGESYQEALDQGLRTLANIYRKMRREGS